MTGTFNRIFERLLVFTVSTSLLLVAMGIFSTALNNYEVDKIFIDWFVYLAIGISGLIYALVLQIFALEKIKAAMHIVFIFFYIVLVLVIAALLGKGYSPYVLIPALFVQYFIAVGINDMFILHDRFLFECETFEGKELETYLFHNNLSAIDLTEKTKTQEVVLFGVSVAMFIVLVFGKLAEGYFNPLINILVVVFYLSILLCYFTLGLFRNDVFYAFLGFKNYMADQKKLLRSVLLIFLISMGLGLLISSNKPLIKFNYFLKEYTEQLEEERPVYNDDFNFAPLPEINLEEAFGKDSKPNWIMELIFQIIKYAAIFFIGGTVIYFLFKPFFTRHWRIFWSEGKLIKFMRSLWDDIKNFFKFIFSKGNSNQPYSTVQSRKFKDSMMDFLKKVKRSKEKEAEIDRLTKHFMKLIDWGEANEIKYKQNLAPAEYTAIIAEKMVTDEKKTAANNTGRLFEKALYDKNVLSAEEEALFVESINTMINQK